MAQSIFSKLLGEVGREKNHNSSIERCKNIIKEIEELLDRRVISYFSSDVGTNFASMINDEDAFIVENLLSVSSDKQNLVLIMHSNGGYAISAERIIAVCKNYCNKANGEFIVIIPKKAKSAATIIALSADKIYLRTTAELGPVDPQFIIRDKKGNIQIEPAYLYVDALENIFDTRPLGCLRKIFTKNSGKPLSKIAVNLKLRLLEQCNYPMYVSAKNELELSDSIIEKISLSKIRKNKQITEHDFDIFRDPHITKSHSRLISISDLKGNGLRKENIINNLKEIFSADVEKFQTLDSLLWELYVRKSRLVNDQGNNIVKTIESVEEFFVNFGTKTNQTKKPPTKKEDSTEKVDKPREEI